METVIYTAEDGRFLSSKTEFDTNSTYDIHSTSKKKRASKPITCNHCKRLFSSISARSRHQRIFHSDKKSCRQCGKLLKENEVHKHEKNFSCHFCGKLFWKRGACNSHIQLVHGHPSEPDQCPVANCNKWFASHQKLQEHINSHFGQRLHCDNCSKTFVSLRNLNEHQKSCSGAAVFTCEFCQKTFKWRRSYTDHKQLVHEGRTYVCICAKSFSQRQGLCRHKKVCKLVAAQAQKQCCQPPPITTAPDLAAASKILT